MIKSIPVHKTITVRTSVDRAFRVFTEEMDRWWPREYHIGKSPMKKVLLECRTGGRCYTEQLDGTNCDWGTVLVWQPPQRFTMAWRITDRWEFESDITRASEVEVTFTPQGDGSTRVDIEHRNFERTVGGGDAMRATVDSPTGWSGLLGLFVAHAEQSDETGSA